MLKFLEKPQAGDERQEEVEKLFHLSNNDHNQMEVCIGPKENKKKFLRKWCNWIETIEKLTKNKGTATKTQEKEFSLELTL